jgi:hypothetical protein
VGGSGYDLRWTARSELGERGEYLNTGGERGSFGSLSLCGGTALQFAESELLSFLEGRLLRLFHEY